MSRFCLVLILEYAGSCKEDIANHLEDLADLVTPVFLQGTGMLQCTEHTHDAAHVLRKHALLLHSLPQGFIAVGMDCRYHGARGSREAYDAALVDAWRGSGEHPFLLDNVWDVTHVVDYLVGRPDVDAARIGLTGISLGGMITWLTAAVEPRIAAAAALIGVHGFRQGPALHPGHPMVLLWDMLYYCCDII